MRHTISLAPSFMMSLALVFTLSTSARAADKEMAAKAATKPEAKIETKMETKADPKGEAKTAPKGKEVTLNGDLGCGKCNFKTTKECQNVLKVSEGGKDTLYYLAANSVSKEKHDEVCSGTKPAMVKGVLSEEGKGAAKKKVVTASEIKVH